MGSECCRTLTQEMKPNFGVLALLHFSLAFPPLAFGMVFAFSAIKTLMKKYAKKIRPSGMQSTTIESATSNSSVN